MFRTFIFSALTLPFLSCGSSHSKHDEDSAPPAKAPNSVVPNASVPNDPQRETADAAPKSGGACQPLPLVTDLSLPLYGNWAAPKFQDREATLYGVFGFRPGKLYIQLTCVSDGESVCVEAETGIIATDKVIRLPDSLPEVSRTLNGKSCTIRRLNSMDAIDYTVDGNVLVLKNFVNGESVWSKIQ